VITGWVVFLSFEGTPHRYAAADARETPANEPFGEVCASIGIYTDKLTRLVGEQKFDHGFCFGIVPRHYRANDQTSAKRSDRRERLNRTLIANDSEFPALL
jgi:hypothetical protein